MKYFCLIIFTIVLSINSYSAQSSDNIEWVKAEGKVQSVKCQAGRKRRTCTAMVSYKTRTGKSVKAAVSVAKIPFIGPFEKAGDSISVVYNKKNPYMARSEKENFLMSYGLYILIALVVGFSLLNIMKIRKRKALA